MVCKTYVKNVGEKSVLQTLERSYKERSYAFIYIIEKTLFNY